MASPSSSRRYDVFVSHAGEDKATLAIPLREALSRQGITAFVDEEDIPPGSAATAVMTTAMENADIAVIVLSPEFVAKKWPMKELLFFLHRREKARGKGQFLPVIIPLFYRLSVADMYREPDLERKTADGKSLYRLTRFFERGDEGEPEADVEIIRLALRTVHGIMGIENVHRASNHESSKPARQLLLNDTCEAISQAIEEHKIRTAHTQEAANSSDDTGQFRRHFHTEPLSNLVLDFASVDSNGNPFTPEGRIKSRIMNSDSNVDQVIAILGIGGVGKSTILKALVNDEDLRERFCDGIHFVSLGKDAKLRTVVQELLRVLGESGATRPTSPLETNGTSDTIRKIAGEALSWFRGKNCLFLIDDVWTKELGVELFSYVVKLGCAGQRSTVVFTTREFDIASVAPEQESIFRVTARETQGKESRDILLCHAGIRETNTARESCSTDSMEEILEACDGLPVSLAAAGKGVKKMAIEMAAHDGEVWSEYSKTLRTCRERLLRENVDEYGNLYITFRASISLLKGRELEKLGFETRACFAEMHRRLCVLPKQAKAPMSMLKHLWELNSEGEARVVAMHFVEVGLAERVRNYDFNSSSAMHLRVHDSIHDFAVSEAKFHGDAKHAHGVLLDGYIGDCRDVLWFKTGLVRSWLQYYCKKERTFIPHSYSDEYLEYINEYWAYHMGNAGARLYFETLQQLFLLFVIVLIKPQVDFYFCTLTRSLVRSLFRFLVRVVILSQGHEGLPFRRSLLQAVWFLCLLSIVANSIDWHLVLFGIAAWFGVIAVWIFVNSVWISWLSIRSVHVILWMFDTRSAGLNAINFVGIVGWLLLNAHLMPVAEGETWFDCLVTVAFVGTSFLMTVFDRLYDL